MGYTTDFEGVIDIDPPLNPKEIEYINKFSSTRRMNRTNGPYYVGGTGTYGQGQDADIIDSNRPDPSQPGLWCGWMVNEEGTQIEWDGGEKFYYAAEWMKYIIDHFISKDPIAKHNNEHFDFLEAHNTNGEIYADGEETDDNWKIEVNDGVVTTKEGTITYG